jgi:hypothetical protein
VVAGIHTSNGEHVARRRTKELSMAAKRKTHSLRIQLDHRMVGTKKIVFAVGGRGGGAFGELQISQGGIAWISKHKHGGRKVTWEQFDDLMRAPRTRQ